MSNNLQLIPAADIKTEKRLEAIKKTVNATELGFRRSGAQMFGYAYMQGVVLLEAKELLQHKQFTPWCEQNFPKIADRTVRFRMGFVEKINAEYQARLEKVTESKTATVAVLPAVASKKSLNKKEQDTMLAIIAEVMDGKGMVEFMQAGNILPEPAEEGGVRLDAAKLEKWLKENHPEFAGKPFDDLPKKIQNAALRALRKPRGETAVDQKEAADQVAADRSEFLRAWAIDEDNLKLCSSAKLKDLEEARLAFGRTIEKIRKQRS